MRTKRFWLAFWYALATLVAPASHDHREPGEDVVPTAIAGCDDPSPHLSGHGAADLSGNDFHCPACQFRAEHQAIAAAPVIAQVALSDLSVVLRDSVRESTPPARACSRAPPLA